MLTAEPPEFCQADHIHWTSSDFNDPAPMSAQKGLGVTWPALEAMKEIPRHGLSDGLRECKTLLATIMSSEVTLAVRRLFQIHW